MTALIIGLSHYSAPISVLERSALDDEGACRVADAMLAGKSVDGAVVVSTCNRLELIADVSSFHGGLADLGGALVDALGMEWQALTAHLYVHYESRAVAHLFALASGLDSLALGEAQILGQLRRALATATDAGHTDSHLSHLLQRALHVGKRVHTDTGLDTVARSMLDEALRPAAEWLGDLRSARALVIGAGAMSGLAVATLSRYGVDSITVANRTLERAERLAAGVDGRAVPIDTDTLEGEIAAADLIVACTGARNTVVSTALARNARDSRSGTQRGQFYVDLALPRDIDPRAGELRGVRLVGLDELSTLVTSADDVPAATAVREARTIVDDEHERFQGERRAESAVPTVVALRGLAHEILESEMSRLESRLAGTDPDVLAEVRTGMNRVADKLVHTPTVRVKELVSQPGGRDYADALKALFDLDVADTPDPAPDTGQAPGLDETDLDKQALDAMPQTAFEAEKICGGES